MTSSIYSFTSLGCYLFILLTSDCYSLGVKRSIPESSVENGFLPSRYWIPDNLNATNEIHEDESK